MTSHRSFLGDDRGAVMVIALFFAVFLVSILYLGVGVGQAVLFREHLQDTADAAAMSGAITHARLMNVIVLINLVMAAMVAVLVALKLVEGLAIVGIAIAAALAYFTGGSSLSAIPPLNALRSNMATLYDELKPTIYQFLELLHDVSDKIVVVAPFASDAVAISEIHGSTVASEGFAIPSAHELPLEDDAYSKLCERGGDLVERLARKPFDKIPPLSVVSGAVLSPVSNLAEAMSQWFCGDGGYKMPDLSQEVDRGYPAPANAEACEKEDITDIERGQEANALSHACEKTEAAKAAAQPDAQGHCQTECGIDGPYEYAVKKARIDCNPSGNPRPSKYRYQLQQMRVWYTWNGTAWVKGTPEVVVSEVREAGTPPCGPSDVHPSIGAGYNPVVHPVDDPTRVQLVCSSEGMPDLPYPDPEADEESNRRFAPEPVAYDYQQVPQIFSCLRKARAAADVKEGEASKGTKQANGKSPKMLNEYVHLGGERFQLRAAVFGNPEQRESARLVRLGLWGKRDPDNPLEALRHLGGFSVAQAEYYFSGPGERDAWMWNMSWRARLKRFDVSGDEVQNDYGNAKNVSKSEGNTDPMVTLAEGCIVVSPVPCAKMLAAVALLKDSLVH